MDPEKGEDEGRQRREKKGRRMPRDEDEEEAVA